MSNLYRLSDEQMTRLRPYCSKSHGKLRVGDANGRPFGFLMTAGEVINHARAAALLDELPKAQWLLGDRG